MILGLTLVQGIRHFGRFWPINSGPLCTLTTTTLRPKPNNFFSWFLVCFSLSHFLNVYFPGAVFGLFFSSSSWQSHKTIAEITHFTSWLTPISDLVASWNPMNLRGKGFNVLTSSVTKLLYIYIVYIMANSFLPFLYWSSELLLY